ncbi:neck protein [Phage vB_KsaM-C1]|nr:neck protein [Phage vB_KsaM-C1]
MVLRITSRMIDYELAKEEVRKKLAATFTRKSVTVGIHENSGMHTAAPGEAAMTNAQLGAKLNYGDETNTLNGHSAPIPPRPWLIPGAMTAIEDITDIVTERLRGDADISSTLDAIGAVTAGAVQQYMTDLRTPPNSPYTIQQKGADNPLIDTGALRASVTWKVTSDKPTEGI